MKKTFAEKRFFYWQEDEVAVSLRNRSGSYGGGSEVLVVEEQPIVFRDDITIKIDGGGKSSVSIAREQSPTLATTHDGAPAVVKGYEQDS